MCKALRTPNLQQLPLTGSAAPHRLSCPSQAQLPPTGLDAPPKTILPRPQRLILKLIQQHVMEVALRESQIILHQFIWKSLKMSNTQLISSCTSQT